MLLYALSEKSAGSRFREANACYPRACYITQVATYLLLFEPTVDDRPRTAVVHGKTSAPRNLGYVPTQEGYLYLVVVVDAYSRKVVGWEMADPLRTERVLGALNMATEQRSPEETVHHSDQDERVRQDVSTQQSGLESAVRRLACAHRWDQPGTAYDNAMGESFFAALACELIERETFASKSAARLSIFEFIEGWYNPERLHSSIGYQSLSCYEEEYHSRDHSQSEEPQSPVAA